MSDYISVPLNFEDFQDAKGYSEESRGESKEKHSNDWNCKCKCTCTRNKPTPPPKPEVEKKEFCAFIRLVSKQEEEPKKDCWCK